MSSFWHLLIDGFKSRTRTKLGALPTTCCRAASAGAHWMALLCNWKLRVHNTDCPLLGMKLRFTTYVASYQIGESHVGLSSWFSWGEMWPWVQPCCLVVPEAARLDEGKFTREEGVGMWRGMASLGSRAAGSDRQYVGMGMLRRLCQERTPGCWGRRISESLLRHREVTWEGESGSRGDGPLHL